MLLRIPTHPPTHPPTITDLNSQHGAGCDGSRLVGGLADVDSLVTGVEVVDAHSSLTHDLNIVRQTLGTALSGPLDIWSGIPANLFGSEKSERQTADNSISGKYSNSRG